MRSIRPLLFACLPACLLASCAAKPPRPESHAAQASVGTLLSGSLDGWVQRGGKAVYRTESGNVIVGETRPNQPNTFLCTVKEYRDFELTLEFKVDPALNSGVQIRSQWRQEKAIERVFGYQVEIDPSARKWTGGLYDEGRRGWLAPLSDHPEAMAAFRQGEWNSMRVRCEGARFRTWINGVPCADLVDAMTPEGFIALQVHGVGAKTEPLEVRWREIRVTPL
jgi:Domain of Unknown Function (DUF1080)